MFRIIRSQFNLYSSGLTTTWGETILSYLISIGEFGEFHFINSTFLTLDLELEVTLKRELEQILRTTFFE